MKQDLLNLLICPITKENLKLGNQNFLQTLNERIGSNKVTNLKGHSINKKLEKVLVNDSETYAYPVISEIPVLLPDEAIGLAES